MQPILSPKADSNDMHLMHAAAADSCISTEIHNFLIFRARPVCHTRTHQTHVNEPLVEYLSFMSTSNPTIFPPWLLRNIFFHFCTWKWPSLWSLLLKAAAAVKAEADWRLSKWFLSQEPIKNFSFCTAGKLQWRIVEVRSNGCFFMGHSRPLFLYFRLFNTQLTVNKCSIYK